MADSRARRKANRASGTSGAGRPGTKARRNHDRGDWRVETLARIRALILEADPDIIEERKWRKPSNAMVGIPVWSHVGIVCTGETYKNVVKLTFARGARLADPARLFNSSLAGGTRRAIDIHEGEAVHPGAFKALVQAAVTENGSVAKKGRPGRARPGR